MRHVPAKDLEAEFKMFNIITKHGVDIYIDLMLISSEMSKYTPCTIKGELAARDAQDKKKW